MKSNKIFLFILIVLFLVGFVSADSSLSVQQDKITILGPEDSNRDKTFTINYAELTQEITFNYQSSDFSDGDNTIDLRFNPSTIDPSTITSPQDITLTADIPDDIDLDIYSGEINVTSGTLTNSFILDIIIIPELCDEGPQGNLKIRDIDKPDDGDNFQPGEEIEINVEVENDGSDDLDVVTKAYLYNMDKGKKIASVESDEKEVEEDDSEDFEMTLKVPTDTDDLKEGDTYYLFIKAFESGSEDENCYEDYVELELELEDEKAIIESVVFSPETVTCGETVTAMIETRNIGSDDLDNVRTEINHFDLGIHKVSSFFDLDEYDEEDDNHYSSRIDFTVPEDAKDGEYEFFDISVLYEGEKTGIEETLDNLPKLTISGCGDEEETLEEGAEASFAVNPSQTSVAVGSELILNYDLKNPTTNDAIYTIEFNPSGNWANMISQQVTIKAGKTLQSSLTTLTNQVTEGTYTGIVSVKSGNKILSSKQISIELVNPNQITGSATFTKKSLFDDLKIGNIPVAFWIIADLILALIILAMVYIVYRR